jgi:hypothetical protein
MFCECCLINKPRRKLKTIMNPQPRLIPVDGGIQAECLGLIVEIPGDLVDVVAIVVGAMQGVISICIFLSFLGLRLAHPA